MGASRIRLRDSWQKAFDHFIEIGYLEGSPDNGETVRVFFSQLEKLNITIPKAVLWRTDEDDEGNDYSYYLFKWDGYLLILNLDGSGEIVIYPGPAKYEATSWSDILSYLKKNDI